MGKLVTFRRGASAMAALLMLAACGQNEVVLPGERLPLRPEMAGAEQAVAGARPFAMPAATVTRDWTHRSGNVLHHLEHVALGSAPKLLWSAEIGAGNDRKHRITSDPVVAGGRVFTVDSRATVTATSTAGKTLWQTDLTPASDRAGEASGGGVSVAGDTVFATSGFGRLAALDAATGAVRWVQELEAPATAAPTVFDGLVYVVTRDSRAIAVKISDGRIVWQLPGTQSPSGVAGGASPAVTDKMAIFPFASGELVATLRLGGVRLWGSMVSGRRPGRAYANVSDIAGDPVIVGDVIYSANHSGRAVALDLASGKRLWTARAGSDEPVWVAGGSVFMITDLNQLVRLDAETGARIWAVDLPFFRNVKPRRRETIFAHWGPILAGGRLLVASTDGKIRAFDPEDGALVATLELPAPAASGMAVVDRTLYIVTADGRLNAYR